MTSRIISLFIDTNSFMILFFLQSNKPQFQALLTSKLAANYHSAVHSTQNLRLLCTSTPSFPRVTPPAPYPLVTGRPTKEFYSSLSDQSCKLSSNCSGKEALTKYPEVANSFTEIKP